MVMPRECRGKVEPIGQRAEVEARAWRLEVKMMDPQAKVELITWKQLSTATRGPKVLKGES